MRDAFFGFLEPPRISSASVLRKGICRGVSEGLFAYQHLDQLPCLA